MIPLRWLGIRQSKAEVINARVTGTGTAVIDEGGNQLTLTDNGVGDWTLTFKRPFRRTPVVTVTTLNADSVAFIASVSTTAVNIKTRTVAASPAAVDTVFHAQIVGFYDNTQR